MKKVMNEETLKNQIIIPFLNDLGFNSSLLSFEENFTIKLGKNTIKKKDYISGRLDILSFSIPPFVQGNIKYIITRLISVFNKKTEIQIKFHDFSFLDN